MNDEGYMRLALDLAKNMVGQTGVNPAVGCVIVKDGRIVGLGSHLKQGSAHAEVHALTMAGTEATDSTVYVTLEPCSHYGKTPPCAEQLIAAHVKRVVIATLDPNPRVAGKGVMKLQEQQIDVDIGLLEDEANQLNEMFNRYITTGRPFVTIKTASTLDGKIAAKTGDSQWITGKQSREVVHMLRHRHDAIMVGIRTVLADDPSLTTRLPAGGIHPIRVIVDSQLSLPLDAKVVKDQQTLTWVLTTDEASPQKADELTERGVQVIRCGHGQVDLAQAMQLLGERAIASILVEGGGRLNGSLLESRLVDKVALFIAPKIIGGAEAPTNFQFSGFSKMDDAIRLTGVTIEQFGDDVCVTGYPLVD